MTLQQSAQSPAVESVLAPLNNKIASQPSQVVLVLDDYHLLGAQRVHDGLRGAGIAIIVSPPICCASDYSGKVGPHRYTRVVDVAGLHWRASQCYEEDGLRLEALYHAARADDVARDERLIEGKGNPRDFQGTVAPILNRLASHTRL